MLRIVGNRLPQATAKAERMFALAPLLVLDLYDLELVRRRLVFHEHELRQTQPSPRRRELVSLIAGDIETLCEGFLALERMSGA